MRAIDSYYRHIHLGLKTFNFSENQAWVNFSIFMNVFFWLNKCDWLAYGVSEAVLCTYRYVCIALIAHPDKLQWWLKQWLPSRLETLNRNSRDDCALNRCSSFDVSMLTTPTTWSRKRTARLWLIRTTNSESTPISVTQYWGGRVESRLQNCTWPSTVGDKSLGGDGDDGDDSLAKCCTCWRRSCWGWIVRNVTNWRDLHQANLTAKYTWCMN